MKKNHYIAVLLLCQLLSFKTAYAQPALCDDTRLDQSKDKKFKRTYRHTKKNRNLRVEDAITITPNDFEKHLGIGNKRMREVYRQPFKMDVGAIDFNGDFAQTWTIPSLNDEPAVVRGYEHVTLEGTEGAESFPDATHSMLMENGTQVFYEASSFDLFALGYTQPNGEGNLDVVPLFQTLAPIPLAMGQAFIGEVILIGFDDEIENDSVRYTQNFDVVGYGTLNMPDAESFEALKIIFNERKEVFKDGEAVIDELVANEFIWYTKEGHFIRVGVESPWESEGETDISYIDMQRVEINEEVTATKDEVASSLTKLYPNPVKAGETLLLDLPDNIQVSQIELFDLQGRSVAVAQAKAAQGQRLEVAVPEGLAEGMYFYKAMLEGGERFVSGRVLVE